VSICPKDYEPDLIAQTTCILKPIVAYYKYISGQESNKILMLPGTMILLVTLPILLKIYTSIPLFLFAFLLSIPQLICLAQFCFLYLH
jgi:hypothetical protein